MALPYLEYENNSVSIATKRTANAGKSVHIPKRLKRTLTDRGSPFRVACNTIFFPILFKGVICMEGKLSMHLRCLTPDKRET